jgi:SAM-dependent methyltransferase
MKLDYAAVGERVQADYRAAVSQYRRDDEIEVTTARHRRLQTTLGNLCLSFDRPIKVLDLGCGTGRYFHCLLNVGQLFGLDLSEEMLREAPRPVRAEQVTVRDIQLANGNAYLATFPPGSFDLIYSLGMFGHGCPVTPEILEKFHAWLAPGGKLFFDTVDVAGLPWKRQLKFQLQEVAAPIVRLRNRWFAPHRKFVPFFGMRRHQLQALLRASPFREFEIESHVSDSPLWRGRHLQCQAVKSSAQ